MRFQKKCGILTSVVSDEPVQPPFNLRTSKCCSVSSLTVIEYSEPLLVAHTKLLEVSCRGSINSIHELCDVFPLEDENQL